MVPLAQETSFIRSLSIACPLSLTIVRPTGSRYHFWTCFNRGTLYFGEFPCPHLLVSWYVCIFRALLCWGDPLCLKQVSIGNLYTRFDLTSIASQFNLLIKMQHVALHITLVEHFFYHEFMIV